MATDQRVTPSPDEMFCPECGKVTPKGGIICGKCGAPLHPDTKHRVPPAKWESWGKEAASLSMVVIVFAPISIYCGWKLYRHYDEGAGMEVFRQVATPLILWVLLIITIWTYW